MKLIEKIDTLGGAVAAIEQEFQQNEIASSAFDYQKAIDDKEKILVGVNKYQSEENVRTNVQKIDQDSVQKQLNRLSKLKKDRNMDDVQKALIALQEVANGSENIMPHIIHAVKVHATLGEISDAFKNVFGEY